MTKENPIVAMQPDKLRESGGIVFDLDSFARHCAPVQAVAPAESTPVPSPPCSPAAPTGVFPVQPVHAGWYPAAPNAAPIPRMAGCLAPSDAQTVLQNGIAITYYTCGSGSGSGTYMSSYQTSWVTSGSGSFFYGSGSGSLHLGSNVYFIGGYGLELI